VAFCRHTAFYDIITRIIKVFLGEKHTGLWRSLLVVVSEKIKRCIVAALFFVVGLRAVPTACSNHAWGGDKRSYFYIAQEYVKEKAFYIKSALIPKRLFTDFFAKRLGRVEPVGGLEFVYWPMTCFQANYSSERDYIEIHGNLSPASVVAAVFSHEVGHAIAAEQRRCVEKGEENECSLSVFEEAQAKNTTLVEVLREREVKASMTLLWFCKNPRYPLQEVKNKEHVDCEFAKKIEQHEKAAKKTLLPVPEHLGFIKTEGLHERFTDKFSDFIEERFADECVPSIKPVLRAARDNLKDIWDANWACCKSFRRDLYACTGIKHDEPLDFSSFLKRSDEQKKEYLKSIDRFVFYGSLDAHPSALSRAVFFHEKLQKIDKQQVEQFKEAQERVDFV